MNNRECMEAGLLYNPGAADIMKEQGGFLDRLYEYNHTRPGEGAKRVALLREMLAECGEHDREYFYRDEKIDWALIEALAEETAR